MELPVLNATLDMYIAEINQFALLKAEEELQLAIRWKQDNDRQAAEQLVVSNLRFVVKIAHEYKNSRFKLADLIQEGNIGLMHAVKKFDPHRGYRLISYAVWWIRAYIQNYIIKTWSIVKIGTTAGQRKLFFKLSRTKKTLESLSKKDPCFAEIAAYLNVRECEVAEMDCRMVQDFSLDSSLSDDGASTYLENLVYEGEDQQTALIKKEEMALAQRSVAGALTVLNEKERFIVRNRLMADEPMTLQEIGNRYNFTRERARQIESLAIKKLQEAIPQYAMQ